MRTLKKIKQGKTILTCHAGRSIEKDAQKRNRKLVAFQDENGNWEGDKEAVEKYYQNFIFRFMEIGSCKK